MPRNKGMTGKQVAARDSLECAVAALVRIEYLLRITRLRMEQARKRCGLGELLDPALAELSEVVSAVRAAKAHIGAALRQVVE